MITRPIDKHRRNEPVRLGFRASCAAILLTLLFAVHPALAGPRICARPQGVPLPPEIAAAIAAPDGPVPDTWGFQRLVRQVRENRRQLEAGLITDAQAAAAGGTRVIGTKAIPVMPFLYNNTAAAPYPAASLQQQLFDGPWPTGTMADYYKEISYTLFGVTGTVYDWTTLAENDTYYEGTGNGLTASGATEEVIIECLDAWDPTVDFGQFDNDGPDGIPNSGDDDGYVDFAVFISPDIGGECLGNNNMWSHAWFLSGWTGSSYVTNDPAAGGGLIRIDRYFISAGQDCGGGQAGIGTMCHEFGHALDIKDLYDTNNMNGTSEGLGHWCLMAGGNWNSQQRPAHMSAWCKERLGWLSYFRVTQNIENLCLPPVETHPVAARMWTNGTVTSEYFVVENRQPLGFDDQLHGNGLVIYHVDEAVYDANAAANAVNGDETQKAIDVECADAMLAGHVANADDLDANINRGDAGDVWCADTKTAFDAVSIPDTRSYSGAATQCAVIDIGSCDGDPGQPPGWICATYLVGVPQVASLCLQDCSSDNCAEITNCSQWWGSPDLWIDNDDDGTNDYPADGIENHLWFRVKNQGPGTLANTQVRLYYSDPAMGQLWPSTGTLIGTKTIPVMNAGDAVEDFVIFEYPDPPVGVDHYCIGAIAVHASDPQNSEYPPNDNNVAQVNHQVLVARAGGKSDQQSCPGPFAKRSRILLQPGYDPEGSGLFGVVRLGTPPNFDDVVIPDNWQLDYDQGPYQVPPGQALEFWFTVMSDDAEHGQEAHIPLTLWDLRTETAAGGVIMDYVIDCYDPQPPETVAIECRDPFGDDLGAPNVKLSWPKVVQDVQGQQERVKQYEVFRGHNQGQPEVLVARVAIDAEPTESGFQWYDSVLWPDGREYTYRIRSVDRAGSPGPFSPPIVVVCNAATSAPDALDLRGYLAQNEPNPFNPSTVIRFQLEVHGPARLVVYDTAGRKVRTLVDEVHAPGEHVVTWDGRNDHGRLMPSGVYVMQLVAPRVHETRKVILAK